MAITMSYGTYNFNPVPLLTINKTYDLSDDGQRVGTIYQVNLQGTVTPLPAGGSGISGVRTLQTGLEVALSGGCNLFKVVCDGATLIHTYPRILNISFPTTPDNWTQRSDYTISMEWDDDPAGSGVDDAEITHYVRSVTENWTVDFMEEFNQFLFGTGAEDGALTPLKVTHNVGAVGKRHCGGTDIIGTLDSEAWEQASGWVTSRLGFDFTMFMSTGIVNLPGEDYRLRNHIRNTQIDERGGSYSVVESWTVLTLTGINNFPISGAALEDFSIDVSTSLEDGLTTASIQGSIQGLEDRSYGTSSGTYSVSETKYVAASGFWNVVRSRLLSRIQIAATGTNVNAINPATVSTSVGHNPPKGTINYSYVYNDRPCNFIDNSLSEQITIVDNHPSDRYAELFVLGRAKGPILQNLSTSTLATRQVSIEAVIAPPTGCESTLAQINFMIGQAPTGEIILFLAAMESGLTDTYDQVFKNSDSSSWNPKTGKYSRNVEWAFGNCDGPAPITTFVGQL